MRIIFGIILIILGVLLILWGVWESYNIFNAKRDVPEIFKLGEETEPSNGQIENVINEQISKIIPKGQIQKMLNLASWAMFMMILVVAGGKLASIGIKLLRKND